MPHVVLLDAAWELAAFFDPCVNHLWCMAVRSFCAEWANGVGAR